MSVSWWIKKSWYIHTIEYDSTIMKKKTWYMLQGWWYSKLLCQVKEETRPNTLYDPLYKNCPLKQATEKESRLVVGWDCGWEQGWLETGTKFLFASFYGIIVKNWILAMATKLCFFIKLHWIITCVNFTLYKLYFNKIVKTISLLYVRNVVRN